MNKKIFRSLLAMIFSVVISGAVNASSIGFYLDQSNELTDNVNYLQVIIDDEGAPGNINFTVTPLLALTSIAGSASNFGIQKFGFNEAGLTAGNIVFTGDASGWSKKPAGGNVSEFGNFTYLVSGKGSNRADPLTFSITNVPGDSISSYAFASSGGAPFFVAHVAGFSIGCSGGENEHEESSSKNSLSLSSDSGNEDDSDNEDECRAVTSAYFAGSAGIAPPGSVVPVPAAAWLFLSGLVGLVGVSRRDRVKL